MQHIIGMPPHIIIIGMPVFIIFIMPSHMLVNISVDMPFIGFISQVMPVLVMVQVIIHMAIGIMPPIIGIIPPIIGFIMGICMAAFIWVILGVE